jgi:uncharacterized protein (DUF58 family)
MAAFVGAWFVGTAIARLTGAAAVLLVLAAGLVALGAAALSSVFGTRSVTSARLRSPGTVDVDTLVQAELSIDGLPRSGDVVICVLYGDAELVRCNRIDFDATGHANISLAFPTPGIVNELAIEVIATGAPGMFWTRRRLTIDIDPIAVAPAPDEPPLEIAAASSRNAGMRSSVRGSPDGDVDGIRPWREGESDSSVHWSSSLRNRGLIVHDRASSSEQRWTVALLADTIDEPTASRLLFTSFKGLRLGHEFAVSTPATSRILNNTTTARSFAAQAIGAARSPQTATTP